MYEPRRKENTENEKQERERVTLRDLRLGRETSIIKGKKKVMQGQLHYVCSDISSRMFSGGCL